MIFLLGRPPPPPLPLPLPLLAFGNIWKHFTNIFQNFFYWFYRTLLIGLFGIRSYHLIERFIKDQKKMKKCIYHHGRWISNYFWIMQSCVVWFPDGTQIACCTTVSLITILERTVLERSMFDRYRSKILIMIWHCLGINQC